MRFLCLLLAGSAAGQNLTIRPADARQGDVVQVLTSAAASAARMNGRTIRLFPQTDGTRLGLLPLESTYKPGDYKIELLGTADNVIETGSLKVRDAHFAKQDVRLSRTLQTLRPAPGEVETLAALRNTVSEVRYWSEPYVRPVPGCLVSPYGVRRYHNGRPTGAAHGGVDLRGAAGTPIEAFAGGVVRIVREFNVTGHVVGIDHGQGMTSMYLHMSTFATKEGATVSKGDVLGYVGTTGRSTAPHLHWTVMVNGVSVNPAQWIPMTPCAAAAPKRGTVKKQS